MSQMSALARLMAVSAGAGAGAGDPVGVGVEGHPTQTSPGGSTSASSAPWAEGGGSASASATARSRTGVSGRRGRRSDGYVRAYVMCIVCCVLCLSNLYPNPNTPLPHPSTTLGTGPSPPVCGTAGRPPGTLTSPHRINPRPQPSLLTLLSSFCPAHVSPSSITHHPSSVIRPLATMTATIAMTACARCAKSTHTRTHADTYTCDHTLPPSHTRPTPTHPHTHTHSHTHSHTKVMPRRGRTVHARDTPMLTSAGMPLHAPSVYRASPSVRFLASFRNQGTWCGVVWRVFILSFYSSFCMWGAPYYG